MNPRRSLNIRRNQAIGTFRQSHDDDLIALKLAIRFAILRPFFDNRVASGDCLLSDLRLMSCRERVITSNGGTPSHIFCAQRLGGNPPQQIWTYQVTELEDRHNGLRQNLRAAKSGII